MKKTIQLLEISLEDITNIIKEAVSTELQKLSDSGGFQKNDEGERLLSREQTCELLQIDPSTLWHWQNKGKIKAYGIGNRRFYKYNEIMESLIPLKTAS